MLPTLWSDLVGYYWEPQRLSIIHLYREPRGNRRERPRRRHGFFLAPTAFIQSPIAIWQPADTVGRTIFKFR